MEQFDRREKFAMNRMDKVNIWIRKAVAADIPVLQRLIEASVGELQAEDYTPAQREGALESVFGVDSQLIVDGTYFVAEARIIDGLPGARETTEGINSGSQWAIAGCGGWSKRKTLYGSDHWTGREDTLLDPKRDAAKIRAFFIHPVWARRGVGSRILEACEAAAREAGFTSYEMGATLTGAKLFGVKGYVAVEKIEVPLKNGLTLPVIHMAKRA
jgi:N-acetylglutamate synthase-like GNAT family acetyltransferase